MKLAHYATVLTLLIKVDKSLQCKSYVLHLRQLVQNQQNPLSNKHTITNLHLHHIFITSTVQLIDAAAHWTYWWRSLIVLCVRSVLIPPAFCLNIRSLYLPSSGYCRSRRCRWENCSGLAPYRPGRVTLCPTGHSSLSSSISERWRWWAVCGIQQRLERNHHLTTSAVALLI